VLAVFAFARLLTALPFTPGGLGVIELALITGLSAAGGARADVAAAVLVFRALTYVLPIPLGALAYVFWRRNKSWRRPPGGAPRTELVAEWVDPDAVPAVDPATGLPAAAAAAPAVDPATGVPAVDPAIGVPAVDPATGAPAAEPDAGLPALDATVPRRGSPTRARDAGAAEG